MKQLLIFTVFLALVGCSGTPSIQEYYVSKTEDPDFLVVDIPTSILGIGKNTLTEEEQDALDSFQKLNVLMFRKTTANADKLPEEMKTVRSIIDGKNFEPLMVMNDRQYSGKLVLTGSVEHPNEIVFFGSASDEGFMVARLIGRKMQVEKAMLLANVLKREGALEHAAEAIGNML